MSNPEKYRHEWKYLIDTAQKELICQRISPFLTLDKNAKNGGYMIRSLYFDDLFDTALREKIDGVNIREKFRIRYYGDDLSFIRLEKKSKINGLCNKIQAQITADETQRILSGDTEWMRSDARVLVRELYLKMKDKGLRPKTIVDYTRDAFVFPAGNVRVTMDYNIRTGMQSVDFLNPASITVPAGNSPIILEVKWDEYLPDVIRDAVQLEGRHTAAFSKYAACRIYG